MVPKKTLCELYKNCTGLICIIVLNSGSCGLQEPFSSWAPQELNRPPKPDILPFYQTHNQLVVIVVVGGSWCNPGRPAPHQHVCRRAIFKKGSVCGDEKQTLSGCEHIIERSGRLLQRLLLIERRLSAADIKIRPLRL